MHIYTQSHTITHTYPHKGANAPVSGWKTEPSSMNTDCVDKPVYNAPQGVTIFGCERDNTHKHKHTFVNAYIFINAYMRTHAHMYARTTASSNPRIQPLPDRGTVASTMRYMFLSSAILRRTTCAGMGKTAGVSAGADWSDVSLDLGLYAQELWSSSIKQAR